MRPKTKGIVFIVVGSLFALLLLPRAINAVFLTLAIILGRAGNLSAFQFGRLLGNISITFVLFVLFILVIRWGSKLVRNKETDVNKKEG